MRRDVLTYCLRYGRSVPPGGKKEVFYLLPEMVGLICKLLPEGSVGASGQNTVRFGVKTFINTEIIVDHEGSRAVECLQIVQIGNFADLAQDIEIFRVLQNKNPPAGRQRCGKKGFPAWSGFPDRGFCNRCAVPGSESCGQRFRQENTFFAKWKPRYHRRREKPPLHPVSSGHGRWIDSASDVRSQLFHFRLCG